MNIKNIYFAGGCFWGVEHFFKGVDGVLTTMPGYANGDVSAPSYEQVYTDTTGHAETVQVGYDPSRVGLGKLVKLFFASIDPLALNRQGHDVGTRYRTGVYYDDIEDLPVLEAEFALVERRLGVPPATELLPLQGFWPAEERHRDYLGKNTMGYCHLDLKVFKYLRLYQDLELLLGDEADPVARQAQTAALLQERMRFFWTGFYNVADISGAAGDPEATATATREAGGPAAKAEGDREAEGPAAKADGAREAGGPAATTEGDREADAMLVLGPFQGPPACFRIARGRGVCGTAWARGRTIVVPDVEGFPGHIACSSLSRSEIVVPLLRDGAVAGVLDIDSTSVGTFDEVDATWLELIADLV